MPGVRRRILQSTLLVVAVTASVLGIPLGFTAVKLVEDFTRNDLATRARDVAATLDERINTSKLVDLNEMQFRVSKDSRVRLYTPITGEVSYGPDPGDHPLVARVPFATNSWVEVAVSSGPLRAEQAQVAIFVLLLVVLSVGTGTIVATVTARRLAEPLAEVANRAARLGAGDFRKNTQRHGVSELDRLADALDASADALAGLVKRERQLVGDVSHQLRSRLTALRLRLEALAEHPEPETAAEAQAALEQAERLSAVLDEMLAAARAARTVEAEPLDLSVELPAIAHDWRELLRARGRSLKLRVPDGLMARATPSRLREAIGVLLDNALKHGAGTVTLSARSDNGTAVVEVSDGGPGVPDQLVGHIFERGVSGGGSTGLGLALARALVDADGGRLEMFSARPPTFAVFLPVPRADQVQGVPLRVDTTPR
jgi:signal transduction histidine kinase